MEINSISNPLFQSLQITNLTELAAKGNLKPASILDTKLLWRLEAVLVRKTRNQVYLLSNLAVKRISLIQQLAQKISLGDVDPSLTSKQILMLDMGELIKLEQLDIIQDRFEKLTLELRHTGTILFIDNIQYLLNDNIRTLIATNLDKGGAQLVSGISEEDHKKFVVPYPQIERRYQPILLDI